ncbi:MAG TPA: glycoside hydrolase family 3 C-terminal domain-containing protein [Amycolatopsis sp.]|uniref:glycoside hydrolase family 3 C-terminal domain-containing protein n=1 Tax=Amycolatopsis sp. TaxID=37632 RepID=UPI002B4A84BC|nr:glycoside hydrolase family 3 C-terminal domain-containing protein [Amycolatopsis sp.]HKS43874.1 glycoside hydrolase family 3 C-terminal domain-containing protein [Amycolatopsis sp.]
MLRNERNTLPLAKSDLRSLAVIGPTARTPLIGGGGSARVIPARADSVLDVLRGRAGPGGGIQFAPGVDLDGVAVPASALSLRRAQAGGATQADSQVDYTSSAALPAGSSWTWAGTLTPPESGVHDLRIQGAGGTQTLGGSITLTLEGTQIGSVDAIIGGDSRLIRTADGLGNAGQQVELTAGRPYAITIRAAAGATTPLQVRLAWVTPQRRQQAIDEAARVARTARTALLFAFNEGTEGQDRSSLSLPEDQDKLIQAVTAANPRTIVVLNVGDPVLMPWLDRTAAVLQMWYPGQEGADATAALLVGEANPGGKLPVTYPKRAEDSPVAAPERYPGVDGHAVYREGVFVGYRHYDAMGIAPLFPFGHGLSYTRFDYRELKVRDSRDGFEVSFTVQNTGDRSGAEVPQVYVGPPNPAPVPMPPRHLAGFARVELRPGERRTVTVKVTGRALSYWSVQRGGWVRATGRREVFVGSSSRDIRLRTTTPTGR